MRLLLTRLLLGRGKDCVVVWYRDMASVVTSSAYLRPPARGYEYYDVTRYEYYDIVISRYETHVLWYCYEWIQDIYNVLCLCHVLSPLLWRGPASSDCTWGMAAHGWGRWGHWQVGHRGHTAVPLLLTTRPLCCRAGAGLGWAGLAGVWTNTPINTSAFN